MYLLRFVPTQFLTDEGAGVQQRDVIDPSFDRASPTVEVPLPQLHQRSLTTPASPQKESGPGLSRFV